MIRRGSAALLLLAALVVAAAPALAQFADQATYAGAGAGTANAQTITLGNATSYSDLIGVLVKYVPAATNTGDATVTVNGFGTSPHVRKPNGSGMTTLTGGEIVSGQPTYLMYDGTYFDLVSPASLPIGAGGLLNSAAGFSVAINLQINATVSANNLTIALKTNAGSDPTAANPIIIPFRDVTIANGDPVFVSQTAASSFTVGSGNTMGCVSGKMCRLWVVGMNNGGSLALCAFNAFLNSTVSPINEAGLQSSQTGTSGGSSAQAYYCNASAVTQKAVRILGYVDIQESTAGTWSTGPTTVQLFGPGIKKPGDVVQFLATVSSAQSSSNSTTKVLAAPQISIAPTSAANFIVVHASGSVQDDTLGQYCTAVISRGTSFQIASVTNGTITTTISGSSVPMSVFAVDTPNTTSPTVYVTFIASSSSNVCTWNPTGGGVANPSSYIEVMEIMGALEPANDDDPVLAVRVG